MRRRTLLLKLALAAFATLAGLEAALWLLHPLSVFPEEWRSTYTQNLPGVKERITYARNSFGMRSVSMADVSARAKPPDTVRVICVGASSTDSPTQNAEDTWWGVLESLLQADVAPRGLKVQVAARGRGGETIMDTVRWCERELLSFEPDIVVVFQGVNDLCWNGGPGYTGQEGADTWQGIARKEWHGYPAWKRWLRWGSQTYRHIAAVRNRLRIRAAMRSGAALEWHSGAMPALRARYRGWPYRVELVRNPDPFDEFSRGMARLLGFLRQHAIAAVVLTQPVLWRAEMEPSAQEPLWMTVATPEGPVRPDPRWLTAEMARYNDRQRQIAAEYGAQVVALDEQIPRTTRLFIDDCHFTDAGHRLAAELIHPALRAAIEAALR